MSYTGRGKVFREARGGEADREDSGIVVPPNTRLFLRFLAVYSDN